MVTAKPQVSVVIATYKGAKTLSFVLDALEQQTYKNFETVVVIKPSADGTEELLRKHDRLLGIKTVVQKSGYLVEAEAIGLKHARGDVVVFFDDDAVPAENCIEEHVNSYKQSKIGGISGDVITSTIFDGKVKGLEEVELPPSESARRCLSARVWNRPLRGLEQYRCCVTRCGSIWHGFWLKDNPVGNYAYWRKKGIVRSFLGMGANMSVLKEAASGFVLDRRREWRRAYGWEQVLAWHVWQNGYRMVHNPHARVDHIFCEGHLTGNLYAMNLKDKVPEHAKEDAKPDFDIVKERHLFFYRLYGKRGGLSLVSKICSILSDTVYSLKNIKDPYELGNLKVLYLSNITGLKWLMSSREPSL